MFFFFKRNLKKQNSEAPIDITNVSYTCLKNIEYFQKNLVTNNSKQIVNYTWEKPSNESPSIFGTNGQENAKSRHTLEIMSTYNGHPHAVKQSRWESDPNGPPQFFPFPQKRRTAVLSTMTQYVEEMNKAFPGGQ